MKEADYVIDLIASSHRPSRLEEAVLEAMAGMVVGIKAMAIIHTPRSNNHNKEEVMEAEGMLHHNKDMDNLKLAMDRLLATLSNLHREAMVNLDHSSSSKDMAISKILMQMEERLAMPMRCKVSVKKRGPHRWTHSLQRSLIFKSESSDLLFLLRSANIMICSRQYHTTD